MNKELNILAVDLHADHAYVAILSNGIYQQYTFLNDRYTAQSLQEAMNKSCESSSVNLNEIDVFAYHSGPGRFSGLRIASGLLHAIAYVTGSRLVACGGLHNMAIGVQKQTKSNQAIAAVITLPNDNGYYRAIYQLERNEWETLKKPEHVKDLDDISDCTLIASDQQLSAGSDQQVYVVPVDIRTLIDYVIEYPNVSVLPMDIKLDYLKKNLFKQNPK